MIDLRKPLAPPVVANDLLEKLVSIIHMYSAVCCLLFSFTALAGVLEAMIYRE
jgi:hypothetical protein